MRIALVIALVIGAWHSDVAAQDSDAAESEIDYAVPENPAFTFLGSSPTKISQPGTPKELGVELANLLDADGRVQQGFALSAPVINYFVHPGPDDARANSVRYWASRTQFSLGTVASSGTATDVAFGFRVTPYDAGDPWTDAAFRKGVDAAIAGCMPADPDDECEPAVQQCMDAAIDKVRKQYQEDHWNAKRVTFGAALGGRLPASEIDGDAFLLGMTSWAVAGLGLGHHAGITAQVRWDMRRGSENSKFQHRAQGGVRAHVGMERWHLLAEAVGGYVLDDGGVPADDFEPDWSVGAEARIVDGYWFAIGLGDALEGEDEVRVLANVRWAVSTKNYFPRP